MTTARHAEGAPEAKGSASLASLLGQISSRRGRVASSANALALEIDGMVLAHQEVVSGGAWTYRIPIAARSLTLKDEAGELRAHLLLDEECEGGLYDQGRLELAISREEDAMLVTLTCL